MLLPPESKIPWPRDRELALGKEVWSNTKEYIDEQKLSDRAQVSHEMAGQFQRAMEASGRGCPVVLQLFHHKADCKLKGIVFLLGHVGGVI